MNAFHKNKSILVTMTVLGIGLIVLGGFVCAVSGITFRSDTDDNKYDEKTEDKNQITGFIYMIGTTFLLLGFVLFVFMIGMMVINEDYPMGLRIAAGIVAILLCQLLFYVFIAAGPLRMLNITGGV